MPADASRIRRVKSCDAVLGTPTKVFCVSPRQCADTVLHDSVKSKCHANQPTELGKWLRPKERRVTTSLLKNGIRRLSRETAEKQTLTHVALLQ